MTSFIKNRQPKLSLRYVFFVSLILWIVASIFITYEYVWSSSEKISSKWGTFVEWIFDSTSYLPYLRTDDQSSFYQGLLFNSCLKYTVTWGKALYEPDLCDIKTQDDQTYILSFSGNAIWSDGTPLSMDDIAFSYDDVVVKNKWNIKTLAAYKDLKITRENPNQLKIIFPTPSVDNKLFFTNYILPKHILQGSDLASYKTVFSVQPTYTNCANIVPQTSDPNSLIFNLLNCQDTHLNFYQIKNLVSFDSFRDGTSAKNSIIDVYLWEEALSGYTTEKLMTNKIVTVFFNTTSDKLHVRTRRALGWLIKRNFYSTGYDDYVLKNADWLFDVFLSTGLNIKDYLSTTETTAINKKDLTDSKVQSFPGTVTVKGENQKAVYYVEQANNAKTLTVNFSNSYDSVALEHKWKTAYDKHYSSRNKNATFTLGQAWTFDPGLNKYILRWWQKGKKTAVASIDIYNIIPQNTGTWVTIIPINVLYFNSPTYVTIVENLKSIFQNAGISEYFTFRGIDDAEEFQNTLLLWDYDISINTIDMGQKKDITKLFATDSANANPSQYQNQNLISLLQQYNTTPALNILNQINDIYAKDMPFVILGKSFVPIHIKDTIVKKVFATSGTQLFDYNWRSTLYDNLQLVNNIHIDGKRVWNPTNFMTFLKESLGLTAPQTSTTTWINL